MLTASTPSCNTTHVAAVNFVSGASPMTATTLSSPLRRMAGLTPEPSPARRWAILATVCLAAFAINVDSTIVNVALPSLTRQLGAGTTDLQWIVDAYTLAFAALVLAAGSLGDRYGRRPALIVGLLGFAASSAVGAACASAGQLIAARFVMGAFAA